MTNSKTPPIEQDGQDHGDEGAEELVGRLGVGLDLDAGSSSARRPVSSAYSATKVVSYGDPSMRSPVTT